MVTWDNADVTLSIDNNGSALTATTQKVAFNAPYGATVSVINTAEEDIELTFTLALLNGMDGVADGSVEVYVPASGGSPMSTVSLPVQLSAGTYTASVSSSTITSASYNATTLSTTEVEITASGDIDTLSLLGANETAEMVVVTIKKPGTAETPYVIASAGQAFENLGAAESTFVGRGTVYSIYFSYTATANGTLSWTFAETFPQYNVSNVEQSDGNWSDYDPYGQTPCHFTVVQGITYTITFEFFDMMGTGGATTSPTFTFTAAQAE